MIISILIEPEVDGNAGEADLIVVDDAKPTSNPVELLREELQPTNFVGEFSEERNNSYINDGGADVLVDAEVGRIVESFAVGDLNNTNTSSEAQNNEVGPSSADLLPNDGIGATATGINPTQMDVDDVTANPVSDKDAIKNHVDAEIVETDTNEVSRLVLLSFK